MTEIERNNQGTRIIHSVGNIKSGDGYPQRLEAGKKSKEVLVVGSQTQFELLRAGGHRLDARKRHEVLSGNLLNARKQIGYRDTVIFGRPNVRPLLSVKLQDVGQHLQVLRGLCSRLDIGDVCKILRAARKQGERTNQNGFE